ncbi:glycosyltransferase, partial [bacterium]|nr:glycosyltransferase [bacterium]
TWNYPVRIEKFVNNMPEWMAAADILVTKAGGLILSEAMAAGLPVIMIDNLPGQESGNMHYIMERQAGTSVEEGSELLDVVRDWLSNERAILHGMTENARKIGHPSSAIDIAHMLWQSSFAQQPLQTISRREATPPFNRKAI